MSTSAVVLVEDHIAFRQALAILFDREPEFRVVGQAGTLAGARRLLGEGAELAVVDLSLPDGSGDEFVKEFLENNPQGIVLVLTASIDPEQTSRTARLGATEILNKSAGIVKIVETARRLMAGR